VLANLARTSPGAAVPRDVLSLVQSVLADRYTVEREIARGGAARVFMARDHSGTRVALKVLHPELTVSLAAERFLREISVLAGISHPRISRLLDYGEREWLVYYVMEFVEGPTLREYLDHVGRAPVKETVVGTCQILEALQFAHEHGVVHRDVKPENIKLSPAGAVLMDFGIAKAVAAYGTSRLTRSGFTVGTSAYMSPEQVAGDRAIDHRADLYSLGCVMFECLAGEPPYQHLDDRLVLSMHQRGPIPDVRKKRRDVPPKLGKLVTRALAKNPDERWQTAAEMRTALEACPPG